MLAAMIPAYAQNRSPKRGICWDEKTQVFSDAPVDKMLQGVTWIYTWGESPRGSVAGIATENGTYTVYNMQGMRVGSGRSFREINVGKGIYIVVSPDGKAQKIVK